MVKQDLPFMNPCWLGLIPRLSRTCRLISPKTVCSTTFPGTELRLTGLQFPASSLQPFLETEKETGRWRWAPHGDGWTAGPDELGDLCQPWKIPVAS